MKYYHTPEFRSLKFEDKLKLLPLEVLVTSVVSYEMIGYSPLADYTVNEWRQHHGRHARAIQEEIDGRMHQLRSFANNVGTGAVAILENNFPNYAFSRDRVRRINSVYEKMEFLLDPTLFSDEYLASRLPAESFPGVQKPIWQYRATTSANDTGEFPVYQTVDEVEMFGRHNTSLDMEAHVFRADAQPGDRTEFPEDELAKMTPAILLVRSKTDIFGKAARSLAEFAATEKGDIWKEDTRIDIFDKAVPRDLVAMTFCYTADPAIAAGVIDSNFRQLAGARLFPGTRIAMRANNPTLPFPHKRLYLTQPAVGVEGFDEFVDRNYRHGNLKRAFNEVPRDSVEVMAIRHRDLVFSELDPRFDHDVYAEMRTKAYRHPETKEWVHYDQRHKSLIAFVSEPGFSLRA